MPSVRPSGGKCDIVLPIVSDALKIDLLVENTLVVEVKAIESINPVDLAQVITYVKLTGIRPAYY